MTSNGPGAGRWAAVLGSPIAHSLSPVLHRAAYAELGLDWRYDAIECDEATLPSLLANLDDDVAGLSLTMPLKRAVIALLDDVSPLVTAAGAANTVVIAHDASGRRRLRGENTDVPGMVGAIEASGHKVASVAVFGAGGTAAAAVAAARELGVARVAVVVRDFSRADDVVAAGSRLAVGVDLVAWPGLAAVREADLVVSTVPAGATDALADAAESPLRVGQLYFDVLYHPWPTRLALRAAEIGADVIGGLELLVRQAALQVELMTGRRPAPLAAMRTAGERALASRAAR